MNNILAIVLMVLSSLMLSGLTTYFLGFPIINKLPVRFNDFRGVIILIFLIFVLFFALYFGSMMVITDI